MENDLKKMFIWIGVIFLLIASIALAMVFLSLNKDNISRYQYDCMSTDQKDEHVPVKTITRPYFVNM